LSNLIEKKCKNCEEDAVALSDLEIQIHLEELNQAWSVGEDGKSIERSYTFPIYSRTIAFVNAVAWIATEEGHHPEMTIGYDYCTISYSTHSIDSLTENDFICAAKIDLLVD